MKAGSVFKEEEDDFTGNSFLGPAAPPLDSSLNARVSEEQMQNSSQIFPGWLVYVC